MKTHRLFFGWWIVLASSIIAFWAGGIFYGFTAFIKPLIDELRWTYLDLSLVGSFRVVEFGLFAAVFGFLADKFGPRKIVFTGGLLSGAGFILLSTIHSLSSFYIATAVLYMGLSGIGVTVITIPVANWFNKKVSKAIGFAISGYGVGGILVLIIAWLISQYQWRATFFMLGFCTWFVVLPTSLFLRHKPEKYGYSPDNESISVLETQQAAIDKVNSVEIEFTVAHAMKVKSFWLLATVFSIQFLIVNAVTFHFMPYFVSIGFSEKFGAIIAMSVPLCSISGRILIGWLGDIIDKRFALVISFIAQAVGLFYFCYGSSAWELFVFVAFFGPGFGGILALRSGILREYFGRSAFGSIHGMIIAIMTLGGVVGPLFAGWIFDIKGSYQLAWLIVFLANVAAVPMALAVEKPSVSLLNRGKAFKNA